MRQANERKTWIGDIEFFRYVREVLKGRAPARDISLFLESNKVPSVFDWSDLRPFLALLRQLTFKRWGGRA
jgi:hypothetical protein